MQVIQSEVMVQNISAPPQNWQIALHWIETLELKHYAQTHGENVYFNLVSSLYNSQNILCIVASRSLRLGNVFLKKLHPAWKLLAALIVEETESRHVSARLILRPLKEASGNSREIEY